MIRTKVQFFYGHAVDEDSYLLNFKEGAGSELTAELNVGEYSLTDFVTEIARALNSAGSLTYSATVDRSTRIITISADGAFTLLGGSGTNIGSDPFELMGFAYSDTSSATSHVGDSASGSVWRPQWSVDSYVSFDDNVQSIDGIIRESTSGKVEAVSFGKRYIMEANFKFITDIYQPPMSSSNASMELENDSSGVANARSFLIYAIGKAPIEFMEDRSQPNNYVQCILESTPESQDGLAFKLKESYSIKLPGYFETGLLRFRKVL